MKHCDCRCVGRAADFAVSPDTLRTLADDHRLCEMPARFRWSMQWAADEITRLRGDAEVARLRLEAAQAEIAKLCLTDEEREAILGAIGAEHQRGAWQWADTLRKLLERLK